MNNIKNAQNTETGVSSQSYFSSSTEKDKGQKEDQVSSSTMKQLQGSDGIKTHPAGKKKKNRLLLSAVRLISDSNVFRLME